MRTKHFYETRLMGKSLFYFKHKNWENPQRLYSITWNNYNNNNSLKTLFVVLRHAMHRLNSQSYALSPYFVVPCTDDTTLMMMIDD